MEKKGCGTKKRPEKPKKRHLRVRITHHIAAGRIEDAAQVTEELSTKKLKSVKIG